MADKATAEAAIERGINELRLWGLEHHRADAVVRSIVEATAGEEIERLRAALIQIAAINDTGANERLALTGSFSSFDEPRSVEIARRALGVHPEDAQAKVLEALR
jgi:hypothetical protein